jgi:hypothetical protein
MKSVSRKEFYEKIAKEINPHAHRFTEHEGIDTKKMKTLYVSQEWVNDSGEVIGLVEVPHTPSENECRFYLIEE